MVKELHNKFLSIVKYKVCNIYGIVRNELIIFLNSNYWHVNVLLEYGKDNIDDTRKTELWFFMGLDFMGIFMSY